MSTQSYTNSVTLTDATEFNRFDTAAYCYLTGVAGTNTITATGPANMTLAAPQHPFVLVPAVTNTGSTTLNITPSGGAALGAKAVFCNGAALVAGELKVGVPALLVYDGTQYQIIGPFVAGVIPGTLTVTGLVTVTAGGIAVSAVAEKANVHSLTYTPTLTNTTNLAASTAYACQYMRVGNTITVSGRVDIDATGAGAILLGLSLPVASNLGASIQCCGTAVSPTDTECFAITGDSSNDRASIEGLAVNTGNHAIYFSFTYLVI